MLRLSIMLALLWALFTLEADAQHRPVIDVHLHAYTELPAGTPAEWTDRPEARALRAPQDADEHMRATLEAMDKYNIVLAVASGSQEAIRAWQDAADGRFIGGAMLSDDGLPEHSVDALRASVEDGTVGVFGELGLQYHGIEPADSRLKPYYDYAEIAGVPIALHTGLGPPGGPHSFAPDFRVTLGRPSLFEPVIAARPDLRAYLMHAGWPYLEETIAMMYIYPNLYADVGVLAWALTKDVFYSTLQTLIGAGFEDRLLFGTDQMLWPEAIGIAIETVESAPFLSEVQKRALLYDNAARFLRLSEEEIAKHKAVSPALGALGRSRAVAQSVPTGAGGAAATADTVLAFAEEWLDAWNELDPERMLQFYDEDLLYYWKGRPMTLEQFERALHEYIIPTESYSIEMAEPHVQVLGPDAAVVAFIWRDKAGPGEEQPPARAAVSLVFERRSGAWKIPHIHESPVSR